MNTKLNETINKCLSLSYGITSCQNCQCTPEECIKNLYAVINGYDFDSVEEMFNDFESKR